MDKKVCGSCKEEKPLTEFYPRRYIRKNKNKEDVLVEEHQSFCKVCQKCNSTYKKDVSGYENIDAMIKFAQSKGYKSASYMIDEIGVKQFKNMYYESIRI